MRRSILCFFVWLSAFSFASSSFAMESSIVSAEDDYAKTKYPIVLIHGFMGSSHLLFTDYFFGIKDELESSGATVYAPSLPAVNSTEVRTVALKSYLQTLMETEGYSKFNLIGHSHGGLSARQVAGDSPTIVASVTTMAAPNGGSYPSDAELEDRNSILDFLHLFIGFTGNLADFKLHPQDKDAYLNSTSTAGVNAFNQSYPAGLPLSPCGDGAEQENGIYQYSMTGIKVFTNFFDPMDYYLFIQSLLTTQQSDGWIEKCASRFGVHRGDFEINHLDEINHLFGLTGGDANPVAIYRNHVNFLKNKGL